MVDNEISKFCTFWYNFGSLSSLQSEIIFKYVQMNGPFCVSCVTSRSTLGQ